MNVRNHMDKHIEIDVGEFSFQNILVYIFILHGLYETVMAFPALLPVGLYMRIVGLVILIAQFRKMRKQMGKQEEDLRLTTGR